MSIVRTTGRISYEIRSGVITPRINPTARIRNYNSSRTNHDNVKNDIKVNHDVKVIEKGF